MPEPVYTFSFTSEFNQSVYNQCSLPDPSGNRQQLVQSKATSMFNVLSLSFFKANQIKSSIVCNNDTYTIVCNK
jgi:hypothetical protein